MCILCLKSIDSETGLYSVYYNLPTMHEYIYCKIFQPIILFYSECESFRHQTIRALVLQIYIYLSHTE